MITLPEERLEREVRRAREAQAAHEAWTREGHAVFWQCVAIAFLGVPVYASSWSLTDPAAIRIVQATGYCVTYVGPWVRFLIFHLRRADHE